MGLCRPQFWLDLHAKHTKRRASQRCVFWCALREGRWPPAAARAPRRCFFSKASMYWTPLLTFDQNFIACRGKMKFSSVSLLNQPMIDERRFTVSKSHLFLKIDLKSKCANLFFLANLPPTIFAQKIFYAFAGMKFVHLKKCKLFRLKLLV